MTISAIETAIKLRLNADLTAENMPALGCKVESFPDKPDMTKLKMLAANGGAVIVRYVGSKYGKLLRERQDRSLTFELIAVTESLAASGRHLGGYGILDAVIERMQGFVPQGCVSGAVFASDTFVDEDLGVWQYGVTVSFGDRVGVLDDAAAVPESDHVREQILRRVLSLLDGLPTTGVNVRRGSIPLLDPVAMPELVVRIGGERPYQDGDSIGASMRVAALQVMICTLGDHTAETSAVMTEVEAALYGDIDGNRLFGGTARGLGFGPVSSSFETGGIVEYTKTLVTYDVAYKVEDGDAETAI